MASPVRESVTVTAYSTSVTSMSPSAPATVNAGDRLVFKVHVRNAGTWTAPSGVAELASQVGGGTVGKLTVFEKIADGTEGGTTFSFTASVGTTAEWHVERYSGVHASTASEVTTTSGDVSAADPPNITPSWGSDDTLYNAVAGHSAASTSAWSAGPSGYSGFQNNGISSGGSAVSLATAYKQTTASSSENPGAFTVSGSNRFWAAATVAIRPAAGGGGGSPTPTRMLMGMGT